MNTIIASALTFFMCSFSNAQMSRTLSKEEVIKLYKNLYLSSKIDSINWNGNVKKCQCGILDSVIYKKAEDRINFFRLVEGLPSVKINAAFNKDAQEAALLTKANDMLTHAPTKDLKCYSDLAYSGCSKSCLSFSEFEYYPETSFITGFMYDYGESNYYVGHRRWLLYSKLSEFGYGATNATEAVLTTSGIASDTKVQNEFIAYPWSGFVPVELIFPKWSFSIPADKNVDFSKATISMYKSDGSLIQCVKLKEYKNYLDHTMVWDAKGLFSADEIMYQKNSLEEKGYLDKKIKVVIKNVSVDGVMKNYEYFVEPFKS